ncbi:MAG: GIY-YIG nuclease family protein [Gemmatimonadetes bacterium]|nr:GIY-YIG nuclease family protein [Gemmatimonadota bacterium]
MTSSPIMQSIVWLDAFDKRRREYKRLGWVYVARNPCFAEPVFKVGQTKVSPVVRVERLSSSTSVYRPFQLVYFVHVSDRDRAEGHVHQALAASRVNPAKEFFEVPIMTVVQALDQAANYWPIQLGRTPRSGYLEPALKPRVVACQQCGGRTKVPRLLISVHVTCKHCSAGFELASDVAG